MKIIARITSTTQGNPARICGVFAAFGRTGLNFDKLDRNLPEEFVEFQKRRFG